MPQGRMTKRCADRPRENSRPIKALTVDLANGARAGEQRDAAFTAAVGHALARPAVLPVPAAPLRLALGALA